MEGTRFWYEIVYSWMAPPSVLASVFHLSSSKKSRTTEVKDEKLHLLFWAGNCFSNVNRYVGHSKIFLVTMKKKRHH